MTAIDGTGGAARARGAGADRVSCAMTTSLGAYVLGAMDQAERRRIGAHLEGCAACRRTLERLMPLPGFLAVVSAQEVARFGVAARPPARDQT